MLRAAVFDMDGLMFDTETLVYQNWQKMMDEAGYPYSLDDFKQTVGKRKAEVQNFYFGKYGAEFPYWDYSEKGRGMYLDYVAQYGVPVKPKIALATSTSRKTSVLNLESAGVTAFFDTLVCGEDVTNGKPHPEVFLTAAERLGENPADCIAFEDSINGIKSAHAAGMVTVMVPDMLQPTDEIIPMIDCLCESLEQSIPFIERSSQ